MRCASKRDTQTCFHPQQQLLVLAIRCEERPLLGAAVDSSLLKTSTTSFMAQLCRSLSLNPSDAIAVERMHSPQAGICCAYLLVLSVTMSPDMSQSEIDTASKRTDDCRPTITPAVQASMLTPAQSRSVQHGVQLLKRPQILRLAISRQCITGHAPGNCLSSRA
jgi:hypothetical protein